jgi:sugar lactone lactonase YvrE
LQSILLLEKASGRPREGGDPVAFEKETGFPHSRERLLAASSDPTNEWHLRRLTSALDTPRAIALSPDELTLYVADRQGLHSFTIRDDTLDARRRLSDHALTGLNVRHDGCIVACSGASLLVLEASGAVRETWPFPGEESVNCAFGGQDLYVTTTAGELWRGRS